MAITANAQIPVFHEGFDAEQTKANTEIGWYEFINTQAGDERIVPADEAYQGAGCLMFVNSQDTYPGSAWQRAVKFRNLPLEGGKIYQIKFAFKGTNRHNAAGEDFQDSDPRCEMAVGLMQGWENSDISILDQNGNGQTKTVSYFNPTEYQEYSYTFYFADKAKQDEKYLAEGKDPQYINDYFATFNIYNPGVFRLDEVTLAELPGAVDEIVYGGDVIRVKYMFDTNIAALANADPLGRVILDPSCATVTVGGEATPVEFVELHKDGYLYIFLEEQYFEGEAEGDIVVTFTNPEDVIDFSGAGGNAKVFAFTAEKAAKYVEAVADVSSFAYEEAQLLITEPENNSFCLEETISEFTFTYDHNVYTCETDDYNAPKAVLSTGEELAIKAGQPDLSKSITFVRTGTEPLSKGMYKITVSGITTEKGTECTTDQILNFETGKIKMAQTVYSDPVITLLTGANGGQPEGWSIMVGGENWNGGEPKADNGSACRNLNVSANGVEYTAFYLCDREGYTYMKTNEAFTIPAGNVEFSLIALSHDDAGHTAEFRLEDLDGNEVATASGACAIVANNNFTSIEASDYIVAKFNNPAEKQVILKVRAPQGGFTAIRVLGYRVRTYTETPGEKFDPEVILESKFTGGNMPAAGTGWVCFNANTPLEPGSGRNGTSGMLERNFHAKMPSAAFFRECGANEDAGHRIEYGNGNGIEGGFEIPEGSYEITYYAGTWNDDGGNAAGNSKVFMQIIDMESGAIVFNSEHVNKANFKNGADCNGQADKIVEPFNCPGGKYMIKAWGTTNTVWGALSIVKPGSTAAKYYSMMQDAVEEAKAELEKCEEAKYDGTAKTALIEAIKLYSDPSFMHTTREFDAAIAELKAKQDAMAARRTTMADYDKVIADAAALLQKIEEGEAKYKNLDTYQPLVDLYNIYKDIPANTLENDELLAKTAAMTDSYTKLNHMVTEGVGVLTEQIVAEAALLVKLDPAMEADEVVLAAGNALTDDQAIANALKLKITKAMYDKLAAGEDIFSEYDAEYEISKDAPIDITCFIQNPKPYCLGFEHNTKISSYPGWHADDENYNFRPDYAWGGTWQGNTTPNHYVNKNTQIGIGWTDSGVTVWNNVTGLPVGEYILAINTMDRSGVSGDAPYEVTEPEKQQSYIYYQIGDAEKVQTPFLVTSIGQYYSFTEDVMEKFELVGEKTVDMTIGAYIHATQSFAAIQNVKLTMIGKKADFDYAAAAAKIAEDIKNDVKNATVETVGEPVKVEFYGLDGKKVAKPAGITIKVATYKNGAMKVSKFMAK